jgi:hypothetical protein
VAGINQDVLYGSNVDFTGSFPVSGQINLDGELLIGAAVAPFIRAGLLTGSGGITITNGPGTINIAGSGAPSFLSFSTPSGTANSSGGAITFAQGSNVSISGGASTVTFTLTGPISPTTFTNHGVLLGQGTSAIVATTAGSTGQHLQSQGASADPTWTIATFPATATGTGTILRADGTNWVASTPTYPNAASTAGKVVISDGTNLIMSTPTFPNASATTRKIIVSDGTNWTASTETWATPSTSGNVLTSDGTNWTSAAAASGVKTILTKFTNASTSWSKNASTVWIEILAWGGGGGGGSGRRNITSAAQGGGGGGAGQFIRHSFDASVFASPTTVTVGQTANGGAVQTVNASNGFNGTIGNDSSVGTIIIAKGGNFGVGGSAAGGTGGTAWAGYIFGSSAGGSSGGGSNAGSGNPSTGIILLQTPTGGGSGGGGITTTGIIASVAGDIFNSDGTTILIAGGTAGSANGGTGGNGNSPTSAKFYPLGGTGGGGGGGGGTAAGGTGGNGASPGGAGGGGGGSLAGLNSGAGGVGARGEVWIIEHL